MFDAEFVCSVFFLTGIFPLVNDQLCILNLEIILEKKEEACFQNISWSDLSKHTHNLYPSVGTLILLPPADEEGYQTKKSHTNPIPKRCRTHIQITPTSCYDYLSAFLVLNNSALEGVCFFLYFVAFDFVILN